MIIFQNGNQILPDWTLHFDEQSANVYHITLTDSFGRRAETTDSDLYQAIKTCEGYAFDIEKQISKDWSRFLFRYSMLKLQNLITFSNGDPQNAYGSWGIRVKEKILTYDGRDDLLIVTDENIHPVNYRVIRIRELSFETFNSYIDFVKQEI